MDPNVDFPTDADGSLVPSDETLTNFSDSYFPDYKYSDNVSLNYDPNYTKARAVTDPNPTDGVYKIRFRKKAFAGKYEMFLTMGHEYVHVAHFMNGLTKYQYTEYAAYKWEHDVLKNYRWTDYANTQIDKAHSYYKPPTYMNHRQNLIYKTFVDPYTKYSSWGIPLFFPRF